MSEANKAAVRGCFEQAQKGNYAALHEYVTPEFVLHPGDVRGVEGLTEMVEGYKSMLADLSVTLEHQFTSGDWVATRTTIRGRHEGDLMGIPPTGRAVEFACLTLSRCRDGRIEEEWEIADSLGLLQQVGALPSPAAA